MINFKCYDDSSILNVMIYSVKTLMMRKMWGCLEPILSSLGSLRRVVVKAYCDNY